MNRDRIEGTWKQLKGTVKVTWGKLTGNPFVVAAGARDQFKGRIQERYGASKEAAARQLKDFLDRNRDWDVLKQ